jgi:hypothetical protein
MRLGATGLLSEEAIHRLADVEPTLRATRSAPTETSVAEPEPDEIRPHRPDLDADADDEVIEPILTAEELRALLHEQPMMPPQAGSFES